jgi:hypothetical protein
MKPGSAETLSASRRRAPLFADRLVAALLVFAAGAAVVAFAIGMLLSQGLGAPSDPGAPAIWAALVALIGAIWTGIVTAVGLAVKSSLDHRTHVLQVESERRLKVETALKIIEIMTAENLSGSALRDRREGAISSLLAIGQPTLALGYIGRYVEDGSLSPASAAAALDAALKSGEPDTVLEAAHVLRSISPYLPREQGDGFFFPTCAYPQWPKHLPHAAKIEIARALYLCMTSRSVEEWQTHGITQFLYGFYNIFRSERTGRLAIISALTAKDLAIFIDDLPRNELEGSGFTPPEGGTIEFEDVARAAEATFDAMGDIAGHWSMSDYELVQRVRDWLGKGRFDEIAARQA